MKCSEKCIHQYFCKFKEEGSNCDYYEEERPHGEWIDAREHCDEFMCSGCNMMYKTNNYNFCPNCGSDNRKRGERDEID